MLRRIRILLASLFVVSVASVSLPAATTTVGGTIKSVAASGKTIAVTIGTGGSAKTESFSVNASTKITLNDKEAKLREIPAGSKVSVNYDKDSKVAASIKAHSATDESKKPEPTKPATTNPAATAKNAPPPAWTMDVAKMQIPDALASGIIHDLPFKIDNAEFQDGVLTLRQGKDFFPDLGLAIFVNLKDGESVEGKSIRVTNKSGFESPHIHLKWRAKPGEGLP